MSDVAIAMFVLWLLIGLAAWYVALWRDFEFERGVMRALDVIALPFGMVLGPLAWLVRWAIINRAPWEVSDVRQSLTKGENA